MVGTSGPTVAVIGGGIAGVSAAYSLLDRDDPPHVVLLEAEGQLAQHTTGRSAALLTENYGTAPIRVLTSAGLSFLHDPPEEHCDEPLLQPRSLLTVGAAGQDELMDRLLAQGKAINPDIEEVSTARARELFPPLRPEAVTRALLEPGASDIDVAALHQCFVRGFRARGGEIAVSTRVDAATADGSSGGWILETTAGPRGTDFVVNAAGAWGDLVAERAGIRPIGLQPMRRTAFMIASAHRPESAGWAMAADADHGWYIKPDGPQFLCSPGDETPSEPVDARPEEVDVALAIERINAATTLDISSVRSSWAGLRTFTHDRTMAIGPDPDRPAFVWCVGQGGTGIQSSPGAGRLLADLVLDGEPGEWFLEVDLDPAAFDPARFRP